LEIEHLGDDIEVTKLTFCGFVLMDLLKEKDDVVKIELVADVETEEQDVTIEAEEDDVVKIELVADAETE